MMPAFSDFSYSLIIQFIFFIVSYWFLVWGIFNTYLIPKKKYDYIKTPNKVLVFFVISSIVPLLIIWKLFPITLISLVPTSLLITISAIYMYRTKNKENFEELLIAKGSDVTFQQLMILILFTFCKDIGIVSELTLGLIFLSIHLPLFFIPRLRLKTKVIFFISIILGGILFAYINMHYWLWSMGINQLIHIMFYVVYWKFFRKQANMGVISFDN